MKQTLLATIVTLGLSETSIAEETRIVLPISLDTGRPVISAMIDDHGPYTFTIDTGTSQYGMGSLNPAITETLGRDPDNFARVSSGPGSTPVEVPLFEIDSLVAGGQDFGSVSLMSFGAGPAARMATDGLISPSAFASHVTEFDYAREEFRILDSPSVEPESWIAFTDRAPMLFTTIEVGGIEMPAVIDTGAPGALSVPQRYEGQLATDGPAERVGKVELIGRIMDIRRAPMEFMLEVSDADFPLESIRFNPFRYANIGSGALRGTTLIIDWPNERWAIIGESTPLYFQP